MALSQMNRTPARLPSARQSSSSAEVWWISSTTTVSCRVMRSSWNQRRAIPVVTITTFQVGVSGVASRSRLTTPTRSDSPRMDSATGRMPRVLPVPVPATMPKPLPPRAHSRSSAPCSRSSTVSTPVRPSASSIVSHAARVGAMTMTRPCEGRSRLKASGSGGRK